MKRKGREREKHPIRTTHRESLYSWKLYMDRDIEAALAVVYTVHFVSGSSGFSVLVILRLTFILLCSSCNTLPLFKCQVGALQDHSHHAYWAYGFSTFTLQDIVEEKKRWYFIYVCIKTCTVRIYMLYRRAVRFQENFTDQCLKDILRLQYIKHLENLKSCMEIHHLKTIWKKWGEKTKQEPEQ